MELLLSGFAEFEQIKKNFAYSGPLLRVAIMNLKKTPGEGKARSKKVEEFAKQNQDYIIREIEIISPQIIICGKVGPALKEVINPGGDWHDTGNGLRCFHWRGIPVLDYYHPAYWSITPSNLDPPLVRATKELLLPRR
jgi:uracil-DNA glycosylase